MAESLVELDDPLAATLAPVPGASLDVVRGSLARSVAPAEAACPAPAWLRPEQVAPFRRALAALERYGGALLADPVGSGKTWIALAVARAAGSAVAIVPAALREQWRRTAALAGTDVVTHSHEALSRGRIPAPDFRLVIVDESHRFRTPGTRRYRSLARWLVGRQVLLLSATPVVNRLADLAHQLRLGVRDDALAAHGVPNLRRLLEGGDTTPALGEVVLCRPRRPDSPAARRHTLAWTPEESDRETLAALDRLRLSRNGATRALIRMVLWRALASSRAALIGTLKRYRLLLEQARDAGTAGRAVSRAEVRAFTQGELDQLVLWEVLPATASPADLVLDDAPAVQALLDRLAGLAPDPRALVLAQVLADRVVSLVFTTSRDTLEFLRKVLAPLQPAWTTGQGSGIGHTRMDREVVLDLFRPGGGAAARATPALRVPTILLATDVAAEGLDLQRAGRIVHFDLPWTSVRVDQREGRALRMGSRLASVEVVRFAPWPDLERRLAQDARLVAKRRLASRAGLDEDGHWLFRWRAELAGTAPGAEVGPGLVMAEGARPGWLIGLAMDLVDGAGRRRPEPAGLFWIDEIGGVSDEASLVAARLADVGDTPARPADAGEIAVARETLLRFTRTRLAGIAASAWLAREAPREQRRLARRLRRVAAEAARTRDRRLLALMDRALAWLAGGCTAGEEALIAELVTVPPARLARALEPLLARPRLRWTPAPRLTGMIGVRVATFPPCQPSGPCSSTSTARSSTPSGSSSRATATP
ncbi:MAG TPA: helicase-related protein [Gemmatimonadales bacterium]|nr:helicase-related protein [Gemmatimonadales bacterium]